MNRVLTAVCVIGFVCIVTGSPAMASGEPVVRAQLDGRVLSGSSDSRPIAIEPRDGDLEVEVTAAAVPLEVRAVRIEGHLLGLQVFTSEVAVKVHVEPGATVARRYRIDLRALEAQASGLLNARLVLLDADRHEIATQPFVADVTAAGWTVSSVFAAGVLGLFVLALALLVRAVRRDQLPSNRARRALRFAPTGLAAGLAVAGSLPIVRVASMGPARGAAAVVAGALAALVVGYVLPGGVARPSVVR